MRQNKNRTVSEEIQKFNENADQWWNPDGCMKSLHDINPLRFAYIRHQTALAGKRVLDAGCGGGILTEAVARQGGQVVGVDASGPLIRTAQRHAEQSGLDIRYLEGEIKEVKELAAETFDVILAMELVEHVSDYPSVIRECANLLEPGGIMIFATINRNILSFLLAIVCAEYLLGLLPRGTHDYKSLVRPAELESACRSAGLKKIDTAGFSYNPVTGTYYFCRNTRVNYMAAFSRE
jgi:2-polyprenyl-6-hydroxyphenyl methylase/3-demethylubiquinone-9 3-methyltransferase